MEGYVVALASSIGARPMEVVELCEGTRSRVSYTAEQRGEGHKVTLDSLCGGRGEIPLVMIPMPRPHHGWRSPWKRFKHSLASVGPFPSTTPVQHSLQQNSIPTLLSAFHAR